MNLRTAGLTALAMLAFAANSLLCRAALAGGHADATSFTALRIAGGAVALGLLARARGSPRPGGGFAWGSAVALFAYAIGFSLAYLRIPAGVGALLLFAAVQFTMIGAGLLAGERPRLVEWMGLGLSIAGLVVLTQPGRARPDPAGALRALVSGALASGLGYAVWYAALRGLTATRAAIVQLSVPPLAAIGGVLVLGEGFSLRLVVVSLLIVGGIALALMGHRRHATGGA